MRTCCPFRPFASWRIYRFVPSQPAIVAEHCPERSVNKLYLAHLPCGRVWAPLCSDRTYGATESGMSAHCSMLNQECGEDVVVPQPTHDWPFLFSIPTTPFYTLSSFLRLCLEHILRGFTGGLTMNSPTSFFDRKTLLGRILVLVPTRGSRPWRELSYSRQVLLTDCAYALSGTYRNLSDSPQCRGIGRVKQASKDCHHVRSAPTSNHRFVHPPPHSDRLF